MSLPQPEIERIQRSLALKSALEFSITGHNWGEYQQDADLVVANADKFLAFLQGKEVPNPRYGETE